MKRNILFAMLLLAAAGMQAQVLYKHGEIKEKVDFGTDKLVKMVFNVNDAASNGDNILFVRQSGDTITFDIDEIYVMGFAEDFTKVDEVKQAGKEAVLYDAATHTVHIVNAGTEGTVRIYHSDGRWVKSVRGTTASVADLEDGLYIVSYNQTLNAKIVKK